MPRSQSSVGAELIWLLIFLVIFAIVAVLLLRFIVPHHFNDRIAVMIAAIVSGFAMIVLRASYLRRRARP